MVLLVFEKWVLVVLCFFARFYSTLALILCKIWQVLNCTFVFFLHMFHLFAGGIVPFQQLCFANIWFLVICQVAHSCQGAAELIVKAIFSFFKLTIKQCLPIMEIISF